MAKDLYSISLRDIMPPSVMHDPQIQSMIDALDPPLQSASLDTLEALIYSRIDTLPESIVDALAWQFHVDFYEPTTVDLDIKRGLVKSAILIHKRKGTKWAVQQICDLALGDTTVEAWHEYGGEPFHFRVSTEGRFPTADAWGKFWLALAETKSVRDWLAAVDIVRSAEMEIRYGIGSIKSGEEVFGLPVPAVDPGGHFAGLALSISGSYTLYQEFPAEEVTENG